MTRRSAFVEEVDRAASLGVIGGTVLAVWLVFLLFRPWWNPATDVFVVVPIFYALAVVGAALTVFLLVVRVRTVDSGGLRWMIAGLAIAAVAALFQAIVVIDFENVPELVAPSGAAALYWIWHGALAVFALGGALAPTRHRLRQGVTVVFGLLLWATLFEPTWELLPEVVAADGVMTAWYLPVTGTLLGLTVVGIAIWGVARGRHAARPDVWVVIMLLLAAVDLAYSLTAGDWDEFVWWRSGPLRAAQFLAPAVGLLADNARMVGLLRRHERGLQAQLDRETALAQRQLDLPPPDVGAEARIREVLAAGAHRTVFQPIVSLDSGQLLAVEALARFASEPARPPNEWIDEAHRVGLGEELELALVEAAMVEARALPMPVALSLNVSPSTLADRRLLPLLDEHRGDRPLLVEITEHAPIADYDHLDEALLALRRRGVRLAVDDAGAGFASLRHVVRLDPDFIKLDMSLTRGVHEDPVRRALARSLADFARQIGAVLIAEGVEVQGELEVLRSLGVDAVQGYLLCRPAPVAQLPASLIATAGRGMSAVTSEGL